VASSSEIVAWVGPVVHDGGEGGGGYLVGWAVDR
jgi:hypothetical protein